MKCQVDAIQWGGGSSRIFSWSPKADAIQWGGGVVAELFRGLQKPTRFTESPTAYNTNDFASVLGIKIFK